MENNIVALSGEVISGFTYSHEVFSEKFYMFNLKVARMSETFDILPIMISERLIDVTKDYVGSYLRVNGQYRSFNKHTGEKTYLVLSVFARAIEFTDDCQDTNYAVFDGYVCKPTNYRKTPLGREITDVLLAVNRPYGKSDYIPCVIWGRNAKFAEGFAVGEHIKVCGRVQSREYTKTVGEETEKRVAYELSVSKVEVVKGEEDAR